MALATVDPPEKVAVPPFPFEQKGQLPLPRKINLALALTKTFFESIQAIIFGVSLHIFF